MVGARVGGRRLAAGVVALLVAASGVVACSDGGGDAGSSVSVPPSPVTSESAAPSVEAPASESPAGEVTAESLSDEELGYIVTSIPEDLTPAQGEVLVAFAAYDRFTWSVWFSPARPGEGIPGADEYLAEDGLQNFQKNYDSRELGAYVTGPVRVTIMSVDVHERQQPATADVVICTDWSAIRYYNADGEDVTPEGSGVTIEYRANMTTVEGGWKSSVEEQLSTNECVV